MGGVKDNKPEKETRIPGEKTKGVAGSTKFESPRNPLTAAERSTSNTTKMTSTMLGECSKRDN